MGYFLGKWRDLINEHMWTIFQEKCRFYIGSFSQWIRFLVCVENYSFLENNDFWVSCICHHVHAYYCCMNIFLSCGLFELLLTCGIVDFDVDDEEVEPKDAASSEK